MVAEDLAFIIGIIAIVALIVKIYYYFRANVKRGIMSFIKTSFAYFGLWVLLPVRIQTEDSEQDKRHKSFSNMALIVFYTAFVIIIFLAYLTTSKSNNDYRNFKNEYENQQRK